jgi:hypothetical protein
MVRAIFNICEKDLMADRIVDEALFGAGAVTTVWQ